MAKQLMPEVELPRRDSDVKLTDDQFLKIGLFAKLKRKPSLDKFPGAMVLRRFKKGEVIFRQGEAGWTAFYILTSEDLLAVEGVEEQAASPERKIDVDVYRSLRPEEMRTLFDMMVKLQKTKGQNDKLRIVATANLAISRPADTTNGSFVQTWRRRLRGQKTTAKKRPLYIPVDGPRNVDYESLQSPLYEGELFGEMSCLYRAPRSATVVATRDCYMLEMLRNILDQLQKDPAYKAQIDEVYKRRVFQLHLRELPLFGDLSDEQFEEIKSAVDLVSFDAGQILFDEFERSDHLYIIRSGLVKIVKKVSALLALDQIRHWKTLLETLRGGEKDPATPVGKLWQRIPEALRSRIREAGDKDLNAADQQAVLDALNDVIKDRSLPDGKEWQPIVAHPAVAAQADEFPEPKKRKDWPDADARRYNRLLLETVLGESIRRFRRRVGPESVLSYCSRNEFIGEMGLADRQPRIASCVAYGHPSDDGPGKETGRVELIRLPVEWFDRLMSTNPGFRKQIQRAIELRKKQNEKLQRKSVWDEGDQLVLSKGFEELGLIQGQRLMLIDLDRCTRCDECVRACVNTHDDGRSRLFLDGPRFDRYLVPTTCRSCLDPVCMIGCPVGSIHRGNNGQIEIEDWCIGCGLCAGNCPYGSILMHDIGILPYGSRGWRLMPAVAVPGDDWFKPAYSDSKWDLGDAPFRYDRLFRGQLKALTPGAETMVERDRAVYFRLEFKLGSHLVKPDSQFKLEMTTTDAAAGVWVNGVAIQPEKPRAGKREYQVPPKPAAAKAGAGPAPAAEPAQLFRAGRNVIAVKVTPGQDPAAMLMDLRLDAIQRPAGAADAGEEVTQKLVTEKAVVCDLCSDSFGQVPACVNACPHDAAMRVDARFEFPVR